jgi:hypothetical protein
MSTLPAASITRFAPPAAAANMAAAAAAHMAASQAQLHRERPCSHDDSAHLASNIHLRLILQPAAAVTNTAAAAAAAVAAAADIPLLIHPKCETLTCWVTQVQQLQSWNQQARFSHNESIHAMGTILKQAQIQTVPKEG